MKQPSVAEPTKFNWERHKLLGAKINPETINATHWNCRSLRLLSLAHWKNLSNLVYWWKIVNTQLEPRKLVHIDLRKGNSNENRIWTSESNFRIQQKSPRLLFSHHQHLRSFALQQFCCHLDNFFFLQQKPNQNKTSYKLYMEQEMVLASCKLWKMDANELTCPTQTPQPKFFGHWIAMGTCLKWQALFWRWSFLAKLSHGNQMLHCFWRTKFRKKIFDCTKFYDILGWSKNLYFGTILNFTVLHSTLLCWSDHIGAIPHQQTNIIYVWIFALKFCTIFIYFFFWWMEMIFIFFFIKFDIPGTRNIWWRPIVPVCRRCNFLRSLSAGPLFGE